MNPPQERRPARRAALLLTLASGILLASGCSGRVGSRLIEQSYPNYGEAFRSVLEDDLLANLVRRRYFEAPQFVALRGISHTQAVSQQFSIGASFSRPLTNGFNGNILDGGTSFEKEDIPTFNITPQQGPDFARHLHERLPLEALPLLANAGYPVELLLTLLAEEIGGITGVKAGPGDSFQPGSPEFERILSAIKTLDDQRHLKVTQVLWEEPEFEHAFGPEVFSPDQITKLTANGNRYITLDGGESFLVTSEKKLPALTLSPTARSTSTGNLLISRLRLDPNRQAWVLQPPKYIQGKQPSTPQSYITIQTRSFYGVLNLLAQGVHVPELEHVDPASGKKSYAKAVSIGLAPDIAARFRVHYSKTRPFHSFACVKTEQGWFYIDADDASSQQVFNVLFDLYQLQVAPLSDPTGVDVAPVLSIRNL